MLRSTVLVSFFFLLVGCGSDVQTAPTPPTPSPTPTPGSGRGQVAKGSLILIVDTSGSMAGPATQDQTRLEVVKDVLVNDFVPLIDDDLALGLLTFDGTQARVAANLARAGDLAKPKWTQKEWVMEAIETSHPQGGTPIVASLLHADRTLGSAGGGSRTIVLLTDGEESHEPERLGPLLRQLQDRGITVFGIGFNIGQGGAALSASLGSRYLEATGGRDALMRALEPVLAAIEK